MKALKEPIGKVVWVRPKSEYGPQMKFPCVIVEVSDDPGEEEFPVHLEPKNKKDQMAMENFPWKDLQTKEPKEGDYK